ncbi:MAG: hypothetical protein AAGA23_05425 [Pseudomonadota bacterium]
MLAFLNVLLDICLLRRGPDALPAVPLAALLVSIVYVALGMALEPTQPPPVYLPWRPLFSLVASFVVVAGLLSIHQKSERLLQTWTAFAGCGSLVTLAAAPMLYSFAYAREHQREAEPLGVLLLFVLIFWSIVIDAHIFRSALSTRFSLGLAWALLSFMVLYLGRSILFP